MKEILLIDDDESILMMVNRYLSKSGYKMFIAKNGEEGFNILKENNSIELIVLDVVMPVMDGVEFCRLIRAENKFKMIPVLMLTAMSDITDKYLGFDAGADDYLTKPFEPLELLLRVQALLKRNKPDFPENEIKPVTKEKVSIAINKENFSVNIKNKDIYFTSVEFDIFNYLFDNYEKPIPVEELLQKVMNYPKKTGNPETIRTHIKNIRSKIEENPSEPKIITTISKRGYMVNKK